MYLRLEKEDGKSIVLGNVEEAELVATWGYAEDLEYWLSLDTSFDQDEDVITQNWYEDEPCDFGGIGDRYPYRVLKVVKRRKVALLQRKGEVFEITFLLPELEGRVETLIADKFRGLQIKPGGVTQDIYEKLIFARVEGVLKEHAIEVSKALVPGKKNRVICRGKDAGGTKLYDVRVTRNGEVERYVFDTKATLHTDTGEVIETWG
jgi:hypothetical protein